METSEMIVLDYRDLKALDKAENTVIKHYEHKNAKALLHAVLVANVDFANSVKDGGRLDRLFARLSHAVNKQGIKMWLAEYTGWKMLADKSGAIKFMSRAENGEKLYYLRDKGRDTPFYEMSSVIKANNKPYNLFETLDKVFAAAAKHQKKGELNDAEKEFFRLMLDAKAKIKADLTKKYGDKPEEKVKVANPQVEEAPKMIEATSEIPFKIIEAEAA